MARLAKSRREKTATKAKASVRKPERSLTLRAKAPAVAAPAATPKTSTESSASGNRKISQKFLEAMEKRKNQGGWGARKPGAMFGRPPARRGRRPKASTAEYTPENGTEESYVLESEFERIEYDTGISKPQGGGATAADDSGFSLDRFDDFDEELNFDR